MISYTRRDSFHKVKEMIMFKRVSKPDSINSMRCFVFVFVLQVVLKEQRTMPFRVRIKSSAGFFFVLQYYEYFSRVNRLCI